MIFFCFNTLWIKLFLNDTKTLTTKLMNVNVLIMFCFLFMAINNKVESFLKITINSIILGLSFALLVNDCLYV